MVDDTTQDHVFNPGPEENRKGFTVISTRIPEKFIARIKEAAERRHLKPSQVIRQAILFALDHLDEE